MSDETEMFEALARDVAAMPARIKRAREAAQAAQDEANQRRGQLAAERAGHMAAIDEADAAHRARCAERERDLQRREAAVTELAREAEEKTRRAEATMRMAEMRAADLSNRLHGHAA
jgi:hypothetical protein